MFSRWLRSARGWFGRRPYASAAFAGRQKRLVQALGAAFCAGAMFSRWLRSVRGWLLRRPGPVRCMRRALSAPGACLTPKIPPSRVQSTSNYQPSRLVISLLKGFKLGGRAFVCGIALVFRLCCGFSLRPRPTPWPARGSAAPRPQVALPTATNPRQTTKELWNRHQDHCA